MLRQRDKQPAVAVPDDVAQLIFRRRRVQRYDTRSEAIQREQVQIDLEPAIERQRNTVTSPHAGRSVRSCQTLCDLAGRIKRVFDRTVRIRCRRNGRRPEKRPAAIPVRRGVKRIVFASSKIDIAFPVAILTIKLEVLLFIAIKLAFATSLT